MFVSTFGRVICINSTEYFNGKSSSAYIYNLGGVRVFNFRVIGAVKLL